MNPFTALWRAFVVGDHGDPMLLDHVPIGGQKLDPPSATVSKPKPEPAPVDWAAKRREALERFAKPLATAAPSPRITEPSRDLAYINEQTETARKVTDIATRRKTK